MKAIRIHEFGEPDVLKLEDIPSPPVGKGQLLVRTRAVGINPVETYTRAGKYGPREFPFTPGNDAAGLVERVGDGVSRFKPGDRVMASAPGGFSEYVVTDAGRAHRIPGNNMTYAQAACFPVALQTMHNAVVTAGRLKRGETLLIQGASSGVGLMGMQIGKVMGASLVLGTSTNAKRRAGIPSKPRAHGLYDHTAYKDQVETMVRNGAVNSDLCKVIGCPVSAVSFHIGTMFGCKIKELRRHLQAQDKPESEEEKWEHILLAEHLSMNRGLSSKLCYGEDYSVGDNSNYQDYYTFHPQARRTH